MEHDASTSPAPGRLAPRVLAVAFAVTAGTFLIVLEQRRARPEPASGPTVHDGVEAPADGAPTSSQEIAEADGAGSNAAGDAFFLMGSKSLQGGVVVPAEQPAAYLSSSKSLSLAPVGAALPPPAVPVGQRDPYLPSSKSGAVVFVHEASPDEEPASDEAAGDEREPRNEP